MKKEGKTYFQVAFLYRIDNLEREIGQQSMKIGQVSKARVKPISFKLKTNNDFHNPGISNHYKPINHKNGWAFVSYVRSRSPRQVKSIVSKDE